MNSQTMLNFEMNGRQKNMAETWQIKRRDWAWKTESKADNFLQFLLMTFAHRFPDFWFMDLSHIPLSCYPSL
jgi:hypothetical protein